LISIGHRTNIQDGTIIHVRGDFPGKQNGLPTVIGSDVTIAHRVTLHGCTIEDGALIGIGAVVLDGAVVKTGTLLAAGSLVPPGKTLDGGLWAGSPAKRLRDLRPEEVEMLKWNPQHYVELARIWKSI
jgi:carbonic anhydrase/acetyltransferase-like protein (isoleucine patch superfamily)